MVSEVRGVEGEVVVVGHDDDLRAVPDRLQAADRPAGRVTPPQQVRARVPERPLIGRRVVRGADALAEFKLVLDTAWAEYEKGRDAAYAEFKKVRDPAEAACKKVCDAALTEFDKVRDAE